MAEEKKLVKPMYHCSKCNLNFTDGAEPANVVNLTGKPEESLEEGEDYGEGVCPNCGTNEKVEEAGEHDWNHGEDTVNG
jgi:hypothetical protein